MAGCGWDDEFLLEPLPTTKVWDGRNLYHNERDIHELRVRLARLYAELQAYRERFPSVVFVEGMGLVDRFGTDGNLISW